MLSLFVKRFKTVTKKTRSLKNPKTLKKPVETSQVDSSSTKLNGNNSILLRKTDLKYYGPYSYFVKRYGGEIDSSLPLKDKKQQMDEKWKSLSDTEKQPFLMATAANNVRLETLFKKLLTQKNKRPFLLEGTSYTLYTKDQASQYDITDPKTLAKTMAEKWHSEEGLKEKYQEIYEKKFLEEFDREQFEKDLKKAMKGIQPYKNAGKPTFYSLYVKSQFEDLKNKNETYDAKEVVKTASRAWKNLTADEKEKLKQSFQVNETETNANEKKELKNQEKLIEIIAKTKDHIYKFEKEFGDLLNKPKRPVNAFALYVQDRLPSMSNTANQEKGIKATQEKVKLIVEEWKSLNAEEKKKYEEKYEESRKKYYRDLEVYQQLLEEYKQS